MSASQVNITKHTLRDTELRNDLGLRVESRDEWRGGTREVEINVFLDNGAKNSPLIMSAGIEQNLSDMKICDEIKVARAIVSNADAPHNRKLMGIKSGAERHAARLLLLEFMIKFASNMHKEVRDHRVRHYMHERLCVCVCVCVCVCACVCVCVFGITLTRERVCGVCLVWGWRARVLLKR